MKRVLVIGGIVIIVALGIAALRVRQIAGIPDEHGYFTDPLFPRPQVTQRPIPADAVRDRSARQRTAAAGVGLSAPKQILFGDTHVHSTYSMDAFLWSLPIMHGSRGAFPPADACDYARYVSQLDFYFMTDHAESYTPQHWRDQVESVRLCNEVAGDPENPDVAAFVGWEWTQVGITAETHYGHHNVLFRDTAPDAIPARSIAAAGAPTRVLRGGTMTLPTTLRFLDSENQSYYEAFNKNLADLAATPNCAEGVNTRDLPADCFESVSTPGALYTKLREWGIDTMVIPHGMSWGYYTPPRATWEDQLVPEHFDPELSGLLEIYSGHGTSEQYRDWVPQYQDDNGNQVCPPPTPDYLPSCWQAGEIIRSRCLAEGVSEEECERRAVEARQIYADGDAVAAWLTVPGSVPADWLDSGQARDMFMPAFNYRPRKSAQYGLALRNFDNPDEPLRYQWGFVASTDTHSARPGHGYKQYDRVQATESFGAASPFWERIVAPPIGKPEAKATLITDREAVMRLGFRALERERQASFFTLGGLAAVHANGRSREAIWEAMKRKEVYGTSGPRILLWFDLLNGGEAELPMGSSVDMTAAPTFRVRAIGSFKQLPGCPDYVTEALSERRLEKLASGECYHPSEERRLIDRIEVVRIRPQSYPDEPVGELIDDPWQVLACEPNPAGCTTEFTDPDFPAGQRDAIYYVRAIEEPAETVNAGNLRATFDAEGNATSVNPCYGSYQVPLSDECLATVGHRAWSSPIYVDYANQ